MNLHRTRTVMNGMEVVEVTSYDVSWTEVRAARDQALLECDWRALKDVVLPTAWKEYRQSLRDLGGFDSANEACDNWPVMPDA